MLVEKSPSKFITSICRKPTFTGQYQRWNFFSSRKHKVNLILTLTHRPLAICSPEKLPWEVDKVKFILQTNGYPEHVIKSFMAKKMKQFHALPALQKSNVIYQFSCHCNSRYVGRTSQMLQDRIKQHVPKSIRSCSSF